MQHQTRFTCITGFFKSSHLLNIAQIFEVKTYKLILCQIHPMPLASHVFYQITNLKFNATIYLT